MSADDELSPAELCPSESATVPVQCRPRPDCQSACLSSPGFIGAVKPLHIFASWLDECPTATKRKTIWPNQIGSPGPVQCGPCTGLSEGLAVWLFGHSKVTFTTYSVLWQMPTNAKYIWAVSWHLICFSLLACGPNKCIDFANGFSTASKMAVTCGSKLVHLNLTNFAHSLAELFDS